MYCCATYIVLAGLVAGAAMDGREITPPQPDPEPEVEAAADESPIRKTGDQITLKSGKVLHGVKIVRQTSFRLVLEVVPGVEPLIIPAKQVASIQYGALQTRYASDPLSLPEREGEPSLLPAVKLSPDLVERIGQPLAEEATSFEKQDVINVLRTAGIMGGVPVTIGPGLEERPAADRRVTLSVPAGASLEEFVRETLARVAPWVAVEFQYDNIHFDARPDEAASDDGADTNTNGSGSHATEPE